MHYFLTGERQVGKSTLIDKLISQTGASVGGFRTSFDENRFTSKYRNLYMYDAAESLIKDEDHVICQIFPDKILSHIERFDTLGSSYINRALINNCDLLIMDECGRLENKAEIFKASVLQALDKAPLVLGVIQIELPKWTEAIFNRPDVELVHINIENRDSEAERLINLVKQELSLQ